MLSPNGTDNIFKAQLDRIRRGGKKEFSLSLLDVNDPVRCNFFYFILLPRKIYHNLVVLIVQSIKSLVYSMTVSNRVILMSDSSTPQMFTKFQPISLTG